jgi:hypothetical protein
MAVFEIGGFLGKAVSQANKLRGVLLKTVRIEQAHEVTKAT